MNTTQAINGEISVGDWVIAAPSDEYGYLIGTVTAIDKLGTPEHDATDNGTDDVHVDYYSFNYPPERIAEIEEQFSDLYGEHKTFGELPIDDAIMAPRDLIRITELGHDEIARMGNLLANCESFCICFPSASPDRYYNEKHTELTERLNKNLSDYHNSLMAFGKRELIDMAGRISAMSDAHIYMSYHGFSDEELDFFLQFHNPLEVVADAWNEHNNDLDGIGDILHDLSVDRDALEDYPLIRDIDPYADESLRRYMNIDLELYLGKIAEKVIIYHPNDWNIDMKTLHKAALSDNPEDKRLMWHVCGFGTHLNTERETFIRGTGAFNTWVDYRRKDDDMFGYVVEVTGYEGRIIKGNVFEVGDYYAHTLHVIETATVLDSVSLTYSDAWGVNAGKTITVPRFEYDDDRHRLMSESGNVISRQYHPSDSVRKMSDILRQERAKRMSLPIGSMGELLRKMADKLAEVRTSPEKTLEKPAPVGKRSITAQIAEADVEAKAHNARQTQNTANITKKMKKEIE